MQLFPERERRGRRFLAIAVALSLIVHLAGGSLWPLFARRFSQTLPPERVAAKLEQITIERHPAPTPSPTPTPLAHGRPHPAARAAARPAPPSLAAVRAFALPTFAPRAEPSAPARDATVHVPRAVALARTIAPRGASGTAATTGTFDPQRLAALDAAFRKTIDQAQQAAAAPAAAERPAAVQTMKRYDKLLEGSITDVEDGEGECEPLEEGNVRGGYTYYYLRCTVHYRDGYSELVSFPWPFRFTPRDDPFRMGPGRHEFPPQGPPAGFSLPHPFALSRAVCAYYRNDCLAIIQREQQAAQ